MTVYRTDALKGTLTREEGKVDHIDIDIAGQQIRGYVVPDNGLIGRMLVLLRSMTGDHCDSHAEPSDVCDRCNALKLLTSFNV